jgi:hypothetical protein
MAVFLSILNPAVISSDCRVLCKKAGSLTSPEEATLSQQPSQGVCVVGAIVIPMLPHANKT